jgi:hypothetical protein
MPKHTPSSTPHHQPPVLLFSSFSLSCRILLVSQNYQPSELLEWCSNKQLTAAMAELQSSSSSNAQQAAMRRGMALHTQQLQPQ